MSTEQTASRAPAPTRPPPWRDVRILRIAVQVLFVVAVAFLLWYLYTTLVTNLQRVGLRTGFGFLTQSAGFTIAGTDFSSRQPIWQAILVGFTNTIRVSLTGIVLATILGVVVGIARLSTNWLTRKVATAFVEAVRNIPLLVFLFVLYLPLLQILPSVSSAWQPFGGFVFSNRGLYVPWIQTREGAGGFWVVVLAGLVVALLIGRWRTRRFDATGEPHHRVLWGVVSVVAVSAVGWLALDGPVLPTVPARSGRLVEGGYVMSVEQGALVLGLTLYTAAFIAEIVRGSIQAVPRGQGEAAQALGLSAFQRMRFVVLPQSMRIAVPPTGNEFLNLAKNSALGIAIAFPELLRVGRIAIGNGQPAAQLFLIMAGIYLLVSLVLSGGTNLINRRLEIPGTR